ncbi:MAG TPA: galactokinase family protein [Gemmatimonadaceae bacterium]|nr:galactokinase family protein [Gemmatimonadaceae bacterium]
MWQLDARADGRRADADVARLVASLDDGYFDPREPIVLARAPGRLDLMGGIADYSGSLVLELPLAVATVVAAQRSTDPRVVVRSAAAEAFGGAAEVAVDVSDLAGLDYDEARALLTSDPSRHWAAYAIGVLVVLARERGLALEGARLLVDSTVPTGKGVSSSAALEVATMRAVSAAHGMELEGRELALLCQRVENLVVGAPCGVMDQMTSACGEEGRLLALLCQPAEPRGHVALPSSLEVWGIDSGIRHAVGDADYAAVRVGTFMGYRIVAELAHLPVRIDGRHAQVTDARWQGFLANLSPSEWEARFRVHVPETMEGDAFLARYGGTTDRVTRVDPSRRYRVRWPTGHPIHEHHRTRLFRSLLDGEPDAPAEERWSLLGELMYQSHASYGSCGLGSGGTDLLVDLVRAAPAEAGLYGAKITGGGRGGVVAVLARRGRVSAVEAIAQAYQRETGREATVLGGSSPGAMPWGVARASWRPVR